jgi:hypothetical protein
LDRIAVVAVAVVVSFGVEQREEVVEGEACCKTQTHSPLPSSLLLLPVLLVQEPVLLLLEPCVDEHTLNSAGVAWDRRRSSRTAKNHLRECCTFHSSRPQRILGVPS